MAKRRSSKEGTCYYSKARGKWVAQLPADKLTGKRALRTANSEAEALTLLREMERERDGGKDHSAKQPTLEAFYQTWLDELIVPHKAPTTATSYRQVFGLYAAPTLGRLRVEAITRQLCQQWANNLAKRVKASVVHNIYRRLDACYDEAVQRGLCVTNPIKGIALPVIEPTEMQTYTLEELRRLLRAADEWRMGPAVWTMALLGTRKGETLGLPLRAYDKKAQTISISQQAQEIDGKVVLRQKTKTPKAKRVLPVAEALAYRYAKAWSAQQIERKLEGWKEHGLMFPSEKGTPIWPTNYNHAFDRLCHRAGLEPITVHGMRHTTATLMGELGVPENVIGVLLGHAPSTITGRYAHVTMDMLRAAVERLAQAIENEEEGRMAR